MTGIRPLTQEEREFATRFHNVIYSYLRERNLNPDDFYDVVVFGFIRAVAKYYDRADLHKYRFTTIAWHCMDSEYVNYCKAQGCYKRCANAGALSLNAPLNEKEDRTLGDTIAAADVIGDHIEYLDLWYQIIPQLSAKQRHVLYLKLKGYSNREIAKKYGIAIKLIEAMFCRMRERGAVDGC